MKEFDVAEHIRAALEIADEQYLPPELIADWEPQECLGSDGATLLVRSHKDGSTAVAKLFLKEQVEADVWETLEELDHPFLPKVMRRYTNERLLIIVREFIEGETLADHLGSDVSSDEEVITLGEKMCDVLGYLHSQQPPIIHRDVKPENIIIRADGGIALIDFGIARRFDKDAAQDTRVMGTQCFAPPEQYGFSQTDPRSDLYALGMVLGWMLTGSADRSKFVNVISPRLRLVIEKCTAFSPKDRYSDAKDLKNALAACRRVPNRKRSWVLALICVVLMAVTAVLLLNRGPQKISFAEPMIEKSVRIQLNKSDTDILTSEDLALIEGIYIFGDAVAADHDGFYTAASNWYSSGTKAHGSITSLEDITQMPNLRHVMIAAQHITDLTPLKGLAKLEKTEFKHNSITDITPLEGMQQLSSVGLNDNPISDISTLVTLPALRFLDLCDSSIYDPEAIGRLGDIEFLDISNRTDSWKYLGDRTIRELKLGWTGIDALDAIAGVSGLEKLEIQHTSICSLEGIEIHTALTDLRIAGCAIDDLSPLKALPALKNLTISEEMRSAAEALGETQFTITYE